MKGRQHGHVMKNGRPVVAQLPRGSEYETATVKSFGLLDSIRTLRGR